MCDGLDLAPIHTSKLLTLRAWFHSQSFKINTLGQSHYKRYHAHESPYDIHNFLSTFAQKGVAFWGTHRVIHVVLVQEG